MSLREKILALAIATLITALGLVAAIAPFLDRTQCVSGEGR